MAFGKAPRKWDCMAIIGSSLRADKMHKFQVCAMSKDHALEQAALTARVTIREGRLPVGECEPIGVAVLGVAE